MKQTLRTCSPRNVGVLNLFNCQKTLKQKRHNPKWIRRHWGQVYSNQIVKSSIEKTFILWTKEEAPPRRMRCIFRLRGRLILHDASTSPMRLLVANGFAYFWCI